MPAKCRQKPAQKSTKRLRLAWPCDDMPVHTTTVWGVYDPARMDSEPRGWACSKGQFFETLSHLPPGGVYGGGRGCALGTAVPSPTGNGSPVFARRSVHPPVNHPIRWFWGGSGGLVGFWGWAGRCLAAPSKNP